MRKTGNYENLSEIKFFIPDPLPPKNPPFELDTEATSLLIETSEILGKLKEMSGRLKNIDQFIKSYIKKESLLSSEIEGVNTTLLEVFTQPLLTSKPEKNAQLVMNYTKALYAAIDMIKKENLPISSRILLDMHKELMEAGDHKKYENKADPGNYRKQIVKVGNLTPAQANKIPELMHELEKFINIDETLPPLIKAGLAHVQFETIHPFLDGNGRIGRLLIVLMLVESGVLIDPSLYPSYYFKKRQFDYYRLLDGVRTNGDFENWIKYYLTVIRDSAIDACKRTRDLELLDQEITQRIEGTKKKGAKTLETKLRTLPILFEWPVINVKTLAAQLGVSYNTANKIIDFFVEIGILIERTEQKRGKLFKFGPFFEIIEREYEL